MYHFFSFFPKLKLEKTDSLLLSLDGFGLLVWILDDMGTLLNKSPRMLLCHLPGIPFLFDF